MENIEEFSVVKKHRKIDVGNVNENVNNEGGKNADSQITIYSILVQGIKSKDKNMLENALSHNNIDTINASVMRLKESLCLELFEEVMDRIEANPMKLLDLSNWIFVLMIKISRILNSSSNGDVTSTKIILNQMERLNEIITMRLSYNKDLINLQATLDIYKRVFDENKTISEMCKKLSSDSDNALITYQFENEVVCDEDEEEVIAEDEDVDEYDENESDDHEDDESESDDHEDDESESDDHEDDEDDKIAKYGEKENEDESEELNYK
ncbi:hypothetical protein FG379_000163 [Cryptosporidium bovis]|uniref:uncharacterized protein n=1 Tax=Cryptosporidium bovis TaxID=310047 RepID=UPI00351A4B5F|nr:hypothetical protein FG379_000163 [Cryptosporidium bovis]